MTNTIDDTWFDYTKTWGTYVDAYGKNIKLHHIDDPTAKLYFGLRLDMGSGSNTLESTLMIF